MSPHNCVINNNQTSHAKDTAMNKMEDILAFVKLYSRFGDPDNKANF
jgi:hypothetical protein